MKTLDLVHVVQLWALHCIPAQRSTPEPAQMGIKRKLKDGVRAFFTGVAAGLQNAHFEGRDARLHHAHTLKRHMERDRRMADFAERQLDAFAYPVQQHGPESHTWSSSPTSGELAAFADHSAQRRFSVLCEAHVEVHTLLLFVCDTHTC